LAVPHRDIVGVTGALLGTHGLFQSRGDGPSIAARAPVPGRLDSDACAESATPRSMIETTLRASGTACPHLNLTPGGTARTRCARSAAAAAVMPVL